MAIVLYCIILTGLIIYGLQLLAVKKTVATAPPKEGNFPPVSILKPLKGLDDNLFDNLSSFCEQDYPEYEIIFCLQERNDPAHKVVKKVRERYPERDLSVIVHDYDRGLNPKVNNIVPAYQAAKHDLILISDSNVMVSPEYLKEIARHMDDPEVGLVTNPIRGRGARTLGSLFENLHMNSFVIGSACLLDRFLKIPCVIGKSMLMRKKDLEEIGGLGSVKDFLAEDYIIGRRISLMGKRVVLSGHLINNVNEYWGFRKFLNRHTRWGKLRWKIGGPAYLTALIS
ncbi:MAG: glycosyltransferase, partial [Nitrospirales bacterium]|nr:glycosyltransferase [Nitrospirales bacterium]